MFERVCLISSSLRRSSSGGVGDLNTDSQVCAIEMLIVYWPKVVVGFSFVYYKVVLSEPSFRFSENAFRHSQLVYKCTIFAAFKL